MQTLPFKNEENLLPFNGEAYLYPSFFNRTEADHYLNYLEKNIRWKQEPIKIYGREVLQPRLTAFYGDKPYSYSGLSLRPAEWNEGLLSIKNRVEAVAKTTFTGALLNQYRNGLDSMGWHRDNEKSLGPNPVIASVSFGATRKFQLRSYQEKEPVLSIELSHGSFLLMRGATQHYWEHQLPKTNKEHGLRINITFRVIL